MTEVKKHNFKLLDSVARQEMASLGGRTAHQLGKAHTFNSESARIASAKGVAVRKEKAAQRAALLTKNSEVKS